VSEQPPAQKIFAALASVIAEVGAVGKNKHNEQQGYNYRSCDDVCDAVRPLLGKAGICVTKKILEKTQEDFKTRNGVLMVWVKMKCLWTFYASDGSSITTESFGEGMDMGDKAINKAETGSLKNTLLQMFMVMGHEDSEVPGPQDEEGGDRQPPSRNDRRPPDQGGRGRQQAQPQGQQGKRPPQEPMPDHCPNCKATGTIHRKRGGGFVCWKSEGGCEHEWQTAKQIAESTPGITTGDQISPPQKTTFEMACETIAHAVQLRDTQMLAGCESRIVERVKEGKITDTEYAELGKKISEAELAIDAALGK